jgi:hypothetical protein
MSHMIILVAGLASGAMWMFGSKSEEPATITGMLRCQRAASGTDPERWVIGLEVTGSKSNPIVLDLSGVQAQAEGLKDRMVRVTATMVPGKQENTWKVSSISPMG